MQLARWIGVCLALSAGGATAYTGQDDSPVVDFETVPPTISSIVVQSANPSNGDQASFRVTFSESVMNFDGAEDVAVGQTGSVVYSGVHIEGSDTIYGVVLNGVTGNGTLSMAGNPNGNIQDLVGNRLASSIGSDLILFDHAPPTAILGSAPNVGPSDADKTSYDFTVNYSDNLAINVDTMGDGNITVTGPGFSQPGMIISVTPPGNGSPRTATYRIIPPGGSWDAADNGTYTISLQGGQVADTVGNVAQAATLGTFQCGIAQQDVSAARSFYYFKYASPGVVNVTVAITGANPLGITVVQLDEAIPNNWTFNTVVTPNPPAVSQPGSGHLRFSWSTGVAVPVTLTYRLNVLSGETGDKTFSGTATCRLNGSSFQTAVGPLTTISPRQHHSSDYKPADYKILLSELLRLIQFYNSAGYHVDASTADGYASGIGSHVSPPHDADYSPQDWKIGLPELLRVVQFYNSSGYHVQEGTADGFAPGP